MANELVKYQTEHGEVTLSPEIIRRYLVPSGTNVTEQEVQLFLQLCKYQGLNPFLREVYLVKYGNYPASIVTGKEVFTKRAMQNPKYAGMEAGIVVQDENGKIVRRDGSMRLMNEKLLGGWAKVHIKDFSVPIADEVSFEEYAAKKSDGTLTGMWSSKPATMIRKVAIVHALREAFPEQFAGLYSQEEINTVDATRLPETPVEIPADYVEVTPVSDDDGMTYADAVEAAPEPQQAPPPVQRPAAKTSSEDISSAFPVGVKYHVKKASPGKTKTGASFVKMLIEKDGYTLEVYDYESHAVNDGDFITIKSMRPIKSREYNGRTYHSTSAEIDLDEPPKLTQEELDAQYPLPFDI